MNKIKTSQLNNVFQYLFLLSMCWLIFYSPFLRGLFFETEQRTAIIFTLSVFILFWIYKWIRKDYIVFRGPLDFALLGLVIVYGISIFVAVSTRDAIFEALKYCMYFVVYYIISDSLNTKNKRNMLLWTILITGLGLSIIGLDGMLGGKLGNYLNEFFVLPGSDVGMFFGTFSGNRIYSTLQYPNTLAIYIGVCFILSIYLGSIHKSKVLKYVLIVISYIMLITILFTQSRGGIIVFGIGIVFLFISCNKENKPELFIRLSIIFLASIVIFLKLYNSLGNMGDDIKTHFIWVLGGLLVVVSIYILCNLIYKILLNLNLSKLVILLKSIITKYIIFVIVIFIIIGIFILNSYTIKPISLEYTEDNSNKVFTKSISIEENTSYKLLIKGESLLIDEEEMIVNIKIQSLNEYQILLGGNTEIYNDNISVTDINNGSIDFKTLNDTKRLSIKLTLNNKGKIILNSIELTNMTEDKKEKDLLAINNYIDRKIFDKIEGLLNGQSSGARQIFYKDGFEIIKERPILGFGGSAWKYVYEKNQSYGYRSTQAHNYPLQLTIETGILGFLIFLLIVYLIYRRIFKRKDKENYWSLNTITLICIGTLIVHSIIDFDLSLSSVMILLWCLIGVFKSTEVEKESKLIKKANKYNDYLIPIILVVLLPIIVAPIKQAMAYNYGSKAREEIEKNELKSASIYMEKAAKLDKYKPHYWFDYANIVVSQSEITSEDINNASNAVVLAQQLGEYDTDLLPNIVNFYFTKIINIDEGLRLLNEIQIQRPHWESSWELSFNWYWALIDYYKSENDIENIYKYVKLGLENINKANKLMEKSIEPILFNTNTMDILERMQYINDSDMESNIYDNVIFYSTFYDINRDGLTDQWSYEQTDNIMSREINIDSNKNYLLKIYGNEHNQYSFIINNISMKKQTLIYNGEYFEGKFLTKDINNTKRNLKIYEESAEDINFDKIIIIEEK